VIRRIRQLKKSGLLGLNSRNGDFILQYNNRRFYPLVDDKVLCKNRLLQHDLPAPALIGVIEMMHQTSHINDVLGDHQEFVIKPSRGSGGDGILVITGRQGGYFIDADGKMVEQGSLEHHLTNVIGGLYSLGGHTDVAMVETLVHFDPVFSRLTYHGVPDIRVIVYKGYPVMAMTRLPTRMSHGKANLHQGAIGVGIDLTSGITTGGVSGNVAVTEHPDTGADIEGFRIPGWGKILLMSARCYEAVELGYLGVDIVLDRDLGPQILELNARPGLNIQIANRGGLRERLAAVDSHNKQHESSEQRAEWSSGQFGEQLPDLLNQTPW
jgi:alpha-L-glutamate ligase-like protein